MHATYSILILMLLICGPVIYNLMKSFIKEEKIFIRRIAGLDSVEEAVGRATEMGKPIFFSPGIAGLTAMQTISGLAVLRHVSGLAAKYGIRIIVTLISYLTQPVAREIVREGYAAAGFPDKYNPDDVMYLSSSQFPYAAGSVGIMHREKVAACFYFGHFAAESLILAEGGNQVGAIQVAGTADILQVPFFITSCDYTIIGEELYAANAYLSQEPTMLACLAGQDRGKLVIMALCLIGTLTATLASYSTVDPAFNWFKELLLW